MASCATIARAIPRTASPSPASRIRANAFGNTTVGRSGTVAYARTNRRNALAHSGSRSSTGLLCGAFSCSARRCSPAPMRTALNASDDARRSHSRRLIARLVRPAGSGYAQLIASRWAVIALRTRRRICPR